MLDAPWIIAQQTEPLLRRLDPATRAKVLAALAGLIILGIAMIALVWLGGRATRRYMGSELAEQYGRRNAVAPEMVVRVTATNVVAMQDIAD